MRFRWTLILILFAGAIGLNGQSIFDKAKSALKKSGISQEDAGLGLKEALNIGVDEAVKQLSQENGYLNTWYRL